MTSKNRNASSYLQTAAVAQQESFDPSTDGDASVRGLPLTTSVSVLALLCRDMVSLQNQTLTADQRRLRMAASHCRWLSYNLGRRGRRNFAERRRKLVLRAVHISRRFIMSGEPGVAIDELNFILKILPNAVLIHAGLVCALLAARRPEAQETLCCYINQQICRVRWHNLVFYQLHQVRSLSGVSRIVSELEALLDCMQPSAAELERIRQRLPDLAGADFDARTVARHGPTASAEAKPEAAGALDTGGASTPHTAAPLCNSINPAPSSGQEDDVSLRLARLKFDLPDFMIFGIEPTLPNNPIEIRLRKAALNWRRRTYAGRFSQDPTFKKVYEWLKGTHIRWFAQIGRKLILHRNIDAAIWQLDAALNYFPDFALLAAVRACAGLIGNRPSGPEILRHYRSQAARTLRWEDIVFDQLRRLRRAPGMRAEIVKEVEAILGCVRPSASKLRDIRWTVQVAPDVSFTGTNYETENETGTDERNALSRNFFTHGPVPPGFLVADAMAASGEYRRALRFYFEILDHCTTSRKRQSARTAAKINPRKAYIRYRIANICLHLLRRGKFERALSAADRALSVFQASAKLHACRAAALMFLNRRDEASALYDRLIARGPDGLAFIERTFDALHIGGLVDPLMEDIAIRARISKEKVA